MLDILPGATVVEMRRLGRGVGCDDGDSDEGRGGVLPEMVIHRHHPG
jgi:hypothetical protein